MHYKATSQVAVTRRHNLDRVWLGSMAINLFPNKLDHRKPYGDTDTAPATQAESWS